MNELPQSAPHSTAPPALLPYTSVYFPVTPPAPSTLAETDSGADLLSDRPSPEPPHSEDWLVFRESFLAYFEPEARATLRAAGDAIYTRVISGDMPREREPWTHARLRALALDLRFAVQLLTELADEPNQTSFADPEETRLQRECPLWAQAISELVLAVDSAIGPAPPQPERS